MTLTATAATPRIWLAGIFLFLWAFALGPVPAPAAEPIKVAVLKFGTVNWELDVIERHGLDRDHGVDLEILPLASKNATAVALQAGDADMIVTDWVWVSRQRAEGAGFTFVPYSTALGALMVPADSDIDALAALDAKRLGIAGGPLDKSWLLLRALAIKAGGGDPDGTADKVFGAPPLLNQQMLTGRIDAVINFWHFCARLEAAGFTRLLDIAQVLRDLGIENRVPMIGYVFDQDWAAGRRQAVEGFTRALQAARDRLAESDEEWEKLRPLMRVEDEATFLALRDGYRRGIPIRWGAAEQADAARLFEIIAELGGAELVGRADRLQDGTFWPHLSF